MRSSLAFLLALLLCLALPAAASAADPLRSQQWGLDMIQADAAHSTSTGSGVTVAVIDTGVLASHEDLTGRLVAGRDFVQPDDVKAIARPVLAHRLMLAPEARAAGLTATRLVDDALEHTPVPV